MTFQSDSAGKDTKNAKTHEAKKAAHDVATPPNLISFMLTKWKTGPRKMPRTLANAKSFAARRAAVSAMFPGELIVVPTGHFKTRANDTHYPFRPSSDFFYLTGNKEPDCVLILVPEGAQHRSVLFVEPNPGKTDATFFTDRVKGELWEGARLGVQESAKLFGIEDTRSLVQLEKDVGAAATRAPSGIRLLRGYSEMVDGWIGKSAEQIGKDKELSTALSEMRLIKDKGEIQELQKVVNATKRGFEDVIRRMKTAKSERELEGVFFTRARMEGNDVGYGSIVASGAHGCTLHWKRNDGKLKKTDLLLLDAGIEGDQLYTADVTRTFPIGGKFSKEQAEIYDLVLEAQRAALKMVKPGNDFLDPNIAAMKVLAHGLERLGILPMTADEALRAENQFYKRYSLHNVSHMLGLDVHDCSHARTEHYKYGKLRPGMVLTIEPGLYFQLDDLTVPARYRGIGIRIEDDVVVTEKGCRNLSGGIPTERKDLEGWIKKLWSGRAK